MIIFIACKSLFRSEMRNLTVDPRSLKTFEIFEVIFVFRNLKNIYTTARIRVGTNSPGQRQDSGVYLMCTWQVWPSVGHLTYPGKHSSIISVIAVFVVTSITFLFHSGFIQCLDYLFDKSVCFSTIIINKRCFLKYFFVLSFFLPFFLSVFFLSFISFFRSFFTYIVSGWLVQTTLP